MIEDGQKAQPPKPEEKPAATPPSGPAQGAAAAKDAVAERVIPDDKPASAAGAPTASAEKPASSAEKPAPSAEKPVTNGTKTPGVKPAEAAPAEQAKPQPLSKRPAAPPPVEATTIPARREVKAIQPADAHVLVVEDNVPNFMLIARLLAFLGVQRCEWKTSGWQVVEFADTLPRIDLILMDIRLPYEDGFQALERVRANDRLKETLVVAVTAEASVEQMKRAREAGFDGFLGKPLDPDRFPEQIRRVLRGDPVWEIH